MFTTFIYLIVALLIYLTHQPSQGPLIGWLQALGLVILLQASYALFARWRFARLPRLSHPLQDQRFSANLTQCFLAALVVHGVTVYGLNLPGVVLQVPLMAAFPTLPAVLFLGLFVFDLALGWAFAYDAHRAIHGPVLDRRTYVFSNLSFSLPVLVPWLIMSSIMDLLMVLPFEGLRRAVATTAGQAVFFLIFLVAVATWGPLLIQRFWRCRPLEPGRVRQRIDQLCRHAGVGYRNIVYWPIFGGRMITAGVMGLWSRFRFIMVTEALMGYLEPEEVDTVIAHEIGHVRHRHLFYYLLIFSGYLLFTFTVYDLVLFLLIYLQSAFGLASRLGLAPVTLTSLFFSLFTILTFVIYFRFLFGYFMRNFERQADTFVYRMFATARPLISTFQKIARAGGTPAEKPNWHHFSLGERMEFLARCEADRSWIARHDRKVKASLTVLTIGLVLLATAGALVNFGPSGRRFDQHLLTRFIEHELQRRPTDVDLLVVLGDLYVRDGHEAAASRTYEKAIALAPELASALNNLAWIYATSDDPSLRNAGRALELALRAARLDPSPHVLDTLAESYFINGKSAAALRTGLMALEAAEGDRRYYEEQVERFREAVERSKGT